ncbi:MAG TPA: tetratricopeptide repeat protein [Phycisphaerae bacterium]|nr:tetratricopeptide repeat protein [Phycisphaerae bacterium]
MRRVVLVLIIVGFLGAVTGGTLWYLHRNTVEKLLARSELAMRAKEYNRALELAESAVAKEGTNWRSYYAKAMALSGKGQYAEAREALVEAARHNPPGVTVPLAVAETYAMPARRALASEDEIRQTSVLVGAVAGLRQANDYLAGVRAPDDAGALDVQQAIGLNLTQMGSAQQLLCDRLEKESQVAATAGDAAANAAKHIAAEESRVEADRLLRQATDTLLPVVKKDPNRAQAARVLVDLCVDRGDQTALAAAREAILSLDDPPPAAVVRLIRAEFRGVDESADPAEEARRLQSAIVRLDAILEKHPADADAKLARAEVAVRAGDIDRAMELCTQVLDSKPDADQRVSARFMRARVLSFQNKWAEAERELYSLRTEVPRWPAVQYYYGLAAHETGKQEPAREAMRAVTEIERQSAKSDPIYAEAHRYLAESLLADGFAPEAFSEARAYYNAVRADPDAGAPSRVAALTLYVHTTKATNQVNLARTALETAAKDDAARPEVLLAVHEGYRLLGENPDAARTALEKAAACTPPTVAGRLAVARAKAMLGRVSEAERMLTEELARSPKDARVPMELGRFFVLTGRPLQAIEQYRAAIRLDDRNLASREFLAAALHESGLDDDCLAECQAILDRNPANAAALRLTNLIRLARGQEMLPQAGPGAPAGLAMAQAMLGSGQPEKCVEVCQEQLKERPTDADARLLLGQAYKMLGQDDKCIEQWTAVLKQMPDKLPVYFQLANIMGRTLKPDAVETALAAIPGAKRDQINLAVGWLYDSRGQYEAAAEAYGRVASRQDTSEDARNLARLFRAQSLARAGHLDQATIELDQVTGTPTSRSRALYYKATLLTAAGRVKEADAILADMVRQAVKDADAATLERIAALYARMPQTDKALAVCDEMGKLLPNDARPCLVRADILTAAGRLAESIDCYRQAIERQPGNLRAYAALARTLDAAGNPQEAMATLKLLEGLGQTGRMGALSERGTMLAQWGLAAQAADTFEQLAELGRGTDPRLQLALGQAFAVLGRKDRARKALGSIAEYAPQYVAAQQVAANLEDTDDARLAVLLQAQKVKPDSSALVVQQMDILLRANRPADAVKVFQALSAKRPAADPVPNDARVLALQAMLAAGDLPAAADLAAQSAQGSADPRWRRVAILLALAQKPDSAKAMLPEISAAGPYDTLLGLLVATETGQPVEPWKKRLDQIQQTLSQRTPPQSLNPSHRILAALVAGATDEATAGSATVRGAGNIGRQVADELTASAKRNPKSPEEAAALLKASLAAEFGMPLLARAWAMQILRARPACQWAAAIALQTRPDAAVSQELLKVLQPADCLLARAAQATLAIEQKDYARAVEIWQSVVQAEKDNTYSMLGLALALEQAGHPADALPLYRQVWEATQNPIAANNAAYIVSCLYPKDDAKLAEAKQWTEAAVKAAPDMPGFRDTLGWIAYLQGRNDEALQSLHRAVKGLPASPEVHFHLGQAEMAAKQADFARWHLQAAVALSDKLRADGETLSTSTLAAAEGARQALAAMERSKP